MFRLLVIIGLLVFGTIEGLAQEELQLETKELVPKRVPFVPPKDAIVANTIEVSGADEFHRIRLERLVASTERTITIPLNNFTDEELSISDVSVSCGCMAAIADSKVLKPNMATNLYLRVSPTETGNFIKNATITLTNQSKIKLVIEAKIDSAFSVLPASLVLKPGDSKGTLLTVRSNFGEQAFSVKSLDPMIELKVVKQDAAEVSFRCMFAEDVDESKIPISFQVPVIISGVHKKHEYSLTVINEDRIEVKPAFMIAARKGVNNFGFLAIITSYGGKSNDVECVLPESASGLTLRLVSTRDGGPATFRNYEIEGNIEGRESIILNWNRSGKTLATTEVFFDRNSQVAKKKMLEARASFNDELIRSGSANALSEP